MSILEKYARIRPIQESDLETVTKLAQVDGHATILPTHVVERNNYIVGSISLGSVPMVLVWMDTKQSKVRDSITVMNFVESQASGKLICVPCQENSPFFKYMPDAGYQAPPGKTVLFFKQPK